MSDQPLVAGGATGSAETEAEAETKAFSEANTQAVQLAAQGKSTTTLPPLGTPVIPIQTTGSGTSGSGASDTGLSATELASLIAAEVVGDDSDVAAFIDESGQASTSTDGWDYFRDTIDQDFTDLESSFESLSDSALDSGVLGTVAEVGAGVTADVADLEVVGFAAFLLLGEYGFGWLLKQVAKLFPNPSIFGWHPLAFIQEGLTSVGNQFEQSASDIGSTLYNVFTQPIRQILGLFQRAFNATSAAHQKIATVVTSTIPQAVNAGIAAHTDDTNTKIENSLIESENYADTVKADLEAEIATAKNEAENASTAQLEAVEANLVSRLQGDEVTLQALSTEVTVTIPNEVETEINEAVATENAALTAQIAPLQQQLAQLEQQLEDQQASIANAQATIDAANTQIANLQSSEEVDEGAIAQQQATIASAQADIATSTTAISDLESQITGISSTLAPIQATQTLNTSSIATLTLIVETSLPVAIAAIGGIVNNLKTEVDECMVDNCDTSNPNNIQNVLRHLLELFTAAAEIGFIAEAVRDPLGVAATLAPILDTIDTSAVDTLNALLEL